MSHVPSSCDANGVAAVLVHCACSGSHIWDSRHPPPALNVMCKCSCANCGCLFSSLAFHVVVFIYECVHMCVNLYLCLRYSSQYTHIGIVVVARPQLHVNSISVCCFAANKSKRGEAFDASGGRLEITLISYNILSQSVRASA